MSGENGADGGAGNGGGGAPRDDGGSPGGGGDERELDAGGSEDDGSGSGERREPLTPEQYQERDRQKSAALREARRESRALQERIAALEQASRGDNRAVEKAREAIKITDPDEDPMQAVKDLRKLAEELQNQRDSEAQATTKEQQQRAFLNGVKSYMGQAEREFAADTPDYYDAAKHWKKDLRERLEDEGYRGEALAAEMQRETVRLVHTARKNGADPAEIIYKRAVKAGYVSKKADEELDTLERGKRNESPTPRGGSPRNGFNVDAALKADGADFEKQWAAYEKRMQGRA